MTDHSWRQRAVGGRDERDVVRTLPVGNERTHGHTRLKSIHHQWDLFTPFRVTALDPFMDAVFFADCAKDNISRHLVLDPGAGMAPEM